MSYRIIKFTKEFERYSVLAKYKGVNNFKDEMD